MFKIKRKIAGGVGSILMLFISFAVHSQIAPNRYWVQFVDKADSPYSIQNPEAFLSERSLDRRAKQNIEITEEDLPVNQSYIDQVLEVGEVQLLNRSKWFNAITIFTLDSDLIDLIEDLDFVGQVKSANVLKKGKMEEEQPYTSQKSYDPIDYGPSYNQLEMLNGQYLHNLDYLGQGMIIFVCDGGFNRLDERTAFDHLFDTGRILGTRDFVDGDDFVYESSTHGTSVMGTMAGILPGQLIGTAPEASYFLARTEDVSSEFMIEEDNWVAAAELADSMGADVINTSLSYTTFDDASMDHTYQDLDGQTTRIAIGAGIAASKGMLIVNSAGNYYSQSWYYIGSPADAFDILAVGALTSEGVHASFSSAGPSADGRVKPEISAQGSAAVSTNTGSDEISFVNGTSFSSPIIAGISACLWQAFPDATAMQVRSAIIESASLYQNPNDMVGYGIPNYQLAYESLESIVGIKDSVLPGKEKRYFQLVAPNPVSDQLRLLIHGTATAEEVCKLQLQNSSGQMVYQIQFDLPALGLSEIFIDMSNYSAGVYTLICSGNSVQEVQRIVKF